MIPPKVRKIEFLNETIKSIRKIKVTLNNGTVIYIERCYESWVQHGGNKDELTVTMPIADRYNHWLHGEDM